MLLPDHLHCIWTLPAGDADFSKRWGTIKQRVGSRCRAQSILVDELSASRQRRREFGLWQRRYWEHSIRNDDDYRTHMDYVHWNPVKHGFVKQASEWPYFQLSAVCTRWVVSRGLGYRRAGGRGKLWRMTIAWCVVSTLRLFGSVCRCAPRTKQGYRIAILENGAQCAPYGCAHSNRRRIDRAAQPLQHALRVAL